MKKLIFLILIILVVGCTKKNNLVKNSQDFGCENVIKASNYVDNNPIKISLYQKENGKYQRKKEFISSFPSLKDIGIFSIILSSNEEEIGSIKDLYKKYSTDKNFSNYKIGYYLKVNLKDDRFVEETILNPKYFTNYLFSDYLYIWLYDDINNSGWYSHIEENDYNLNTVMSSIKLMATEKGSLEIENVMLTVFTYDEDDFDNNGYYWGNSKFTTLIKR